MYLKFLILCGYWDISNCSTRKIPEKFHNYPQRDTSKLPLFKSLLKIPVAFKGENNKRAPSPACQDFVQALIIIVLINLLQEYS